jgi:DNA-binding NtrC family response regulator
MNDPGGGGLDGLKVLIVEDETLVAMLLEDMLADHGCVVAGTADRIAQAMALIKDDSLVIEAAILDVNLGGEASFPLAEILAAKGVPFVFATGYGVGGLPEAWRDRPTLQKPFSLDEVARMLRQAIGR